MLPCLALFYLVLGGLLPQTSQAQVVINEVSSDNNRVLVDEFGDFSDWIELYNPSNDALDLSLYFLSDKLDNLQRWQLPLGTSISPQGFLLVFASGKDTIGQAIHTNFRLSKAGEVLTLSNPNGLPIDQFPALAIPENHSYGRLEDGSNSKVFFAHPSPNASNQDWSGYPIDAEQIAMPSFSLASSLHQTGFELSIQHPNESANVYYTLNGAPPTPASPLYTTPLWIDTTTVIRVRAFANGLQPSNINSASYIFNDPTHLPILSIVLDSVDFWDWYKGINVLGPHAQANFPYWGANVWQDWEIPVHVSYFDAGELAFEQNMGLETHGGRSARLNPMRSLRLKAKEKYGKPSIDYPIFKDKDNPSYKRLVLRNSGSDYNQTHFRDAFIHQHLLRESPFQPNIDLDVSAYQAAVVYLNGEFWGLFNLREKIDRYYVEDNYGLSPDNIDLLEEDTLVVNGDFEAFHALHDFITTNDMRLENNYEQAAKQLDIRSFCDYFITQTYLANVDWPFNNLKYWRERKEDAQWRYLFFDLDVTLRGNPHVWPCTDLLGFILGDIGDATAHVRILKSLLQNEAFKQYFISRYADLMNSVFEVDYFLAEMDKVKTNIAPDMARQCEKWDCDLISWEAVINDEAAFFIENRLPCARDLLQTNFDLAEQTTLNIRILPAKAGQIQVNTLTIDTAKWQGVYYQDLPIDLLANAQEGYVFSHWDILETTTPIDHSLPNYTLKSQSKELTVVAHFESSNGQAVETSLFPNPISRTQQHFFVQWHNAQNELLQTSWYNSLGQLVSTTQQNTTIGNQYLSFDLPNGLIKGIYFLKLETATKMEVLKVFIH
ncbi:MAG: CotH kinase family protein [Chitinophagales bacterium]